MLDDHDESVRIAVRALGDMRHGARTHDGDTGDFVARVATLPLVGTALRAYEHGKASSRVVKYGAEIMESSVKNMSRPVIDRLPLDVNQLACRQLDRLERYRRPSTSDDKMADDDATESRSPTPQSQSQLDRQVVPRSRWQTVLLEAGGIGAAFSEESMRRLKYCLQWLQYATTHIDAQILILRGFIDSLQAFVVDAADEDAYVSPTHIRTLHDIRRDVVHTIRQVVDVVSKYAGSALPEPARARVRGFILHLPQRWATATASVPEHNTGTSSVGGASTGRRTGRHRKERIAGGPDRSLSTTPASSRASSPLASSRTSVARPTAGAATRAAQHILTLATESLDMMRGVTGVVKESLDRADAWVERLRVIGVQRAQQPVPEEEPFDATMSSRQSIPGLSSSPSTPARVDTPLSIPSTPSTYASPDGVRLGGEMSARNSLSELHLGEDTDGYETPKSGFSLLEEEPERREMMVDG